MGVISDTIQERDAQGRPASDTSEQESGGTDPADLPESIDPFLQRYLTDEYQADTETVNQILTALIAAGNLL
ncbi:hypothetical protein BGV91_gp22 [Haloarcula californiae icosahedral virus 1]|uniref:Uncharacterized protein n=1 Tax=Haloarcula californiae icosahedral virus 1 TaxID=1735722 RepID=A0A1C7A3R3_9VIRU|nr:hypothetical protein BGV91_gp22 [Haloarcula californiae icosahedral virus 1]ALJ99685.1 hypothetical protein SS136_022 [Haloarcula californiae icosahedral virus 1]